MPEKALFCPECASQSKCKSCSELLIKDAKLCVYCGEDVKQKTTGKGMNSIEFTENENGGRSFKATFSDTVGQSIIDSLGIIIADKIAGRKLTIEIPEVPESDFQPLLTETEFFHIPDVYEDTPQQTVNDTANDLNAEFDLLIKNDVVSHEENDKINDVVNDTEIEDDIALMQAELANYPPVIDASNDEFMHDLEQIFKEEVDADDIDFDMEIDQSNVPTEPIFVHIPDISSFIQSAFIPAPQEAEKNDVEAELLPIIEPITALPIISIEPTATTSPKNDVETTAIASQKNDVETTATTSPKNDVEQQGKPIDIHSSFPLLLETKLKAKSKREYGQQLVLLYVYYNALLNKQSVKRSDLWLLLDQAGVADGNIRSWIGKNSLLNIVNDYAELTKAGLHAAQEYINEILDNTLPDVLQQPAQEPPLIVRKPGKAKHDDGAVETPFPATLSSGMLAP
ncbi:MAG: zinc ribbon domain-containing protein [Chitinophagia bacterium]|nr:zinc ribbon domain-containing protein [Chitinophagia bacterium]